MTEGDEWHRDASVRAMRRLFSRMEAGQDDLLERLGISVHDSRLRACREDARDLFERMLSRFAAGRGHHEEDAAALYIHCLIEALKERGLPVPDGAVGKDVGRKEQVEEAIK